MKRIILAFLLLLMPLAPVGWTGMTCSNSATRTTYNTLFTVGQGVNQAYAAWNDQVVLGKATFSPVVAKAYNDFQAAYGVAVAGAQLGTAAPATQNINDLANAVYAAINAFTKK